MTKGVEANVGTCAGLFVVEMRLVRAPATGEASVVGNYDNYRAGKTAADGLVDWRREMGSGK